MIRISLLARGALCAAAIASAPVSAQAPAVRAHAARVVINRARVNDVTDLRVLILADLDRRDAVWRAVGRLGGRVEARFDELGYRRVRMHRDRILALDTIRGITSFHVDVGGDPSYDIDLDFADWDGEGWKRVVETIERDRAATEAHSDGPYRPVLDAPAFRRGSPYVPWNDMGTDAFAAAHPTFDGRGVTIAIVERFPEFTHPAIQHALTLAGDTVRKIAGIIDPAAAETPLARSYRALPNIRPIVARHVEQAGVVHSDADGMLAWEGKRYHAPALGAYRAGTYRRGARAYPVLWAPERRLVWLDTSGRGDFRDVAPLTDFNTRYSLGMLPAADSVSAAIPFAVTIDSAGDRVRIHPGTSSHTMMLVSGAAATPYPGGDVGGVAPGARVVLAEYGDALNEKLEAFIRAARRPDVDIVTCSCIFATFPGLGEGFAARVLDRLVRVYRKPLLVPAGNSGPMLTEAGDEGATQLIQVGAYTGRASYLAHQGVRLGAREDWVAAYSAWGPGGTGAMKPDLLAPMNAVVADPCSTRATTGGTVYRLPECYRLGGGTSLATPVAAASAALLVSAAK
ncbi:MAG TPA: S8 family serine peptidase, partial [Gemmatimonadaceae bacterium]|nr:S8 family serine peptidase [Gemmatimonadaceae bacterium]